MLAKKSDGAQSIHRAIELLRLIAREGRRGARLTPLARASELSLPTARRILKSLMDDGMVVQTEHPRKYELGPLIAELALLEPFNSQLIGQWRPVLTRICEKSGCTTVLVKRSYLDTIIVDRVDSKSYLRAVTFDVGQRYPLGIGAISLAVLASQPNEELARILELNSHQYRKYEDIGVQRVRTQVNRTRREGYAFSKVRRLPGVCSMGVAIPNPTGSPTLGIGIAVSGMHIEPARREHLAKLLKREVALAENARTRSL